MEDFWSWPNIDIMGYDGHPLLAWYKCVNFESELWFELEKFIWINHRSVYQYNMKYICNDIVKPFKVKILHYSECVTQMHDLAKYLTPPSMKGKRSGTSNWTLHNQ